MDKGILEKITFPRGILAVSDMTPDEKKLLYAEMERLGSCHSFAYKRFFQDGFDQWEIEGIIAIKVAFIKWLQTVEKLFIEVRCVGETPVAGDDPVPLYRYFYRIPPKATEGQSFEEHSFDINAPGDFWRFLGDIGYRIRFSQFVAPKGMETFVTVSRRYKEDNWREWEKVGIRQIVESFIEKYA